MRASQQAVELGFCLALGGLDHERPGDGPAQRGGVKAVVHEPLRHVLGGRELVEPRRSMMHSWATRPLAPLKSTGKYLSAAGGHVVGVQDGEALVASVRPSPPIMRIYIHGMMQDAEALPNGAAEMEPVCCVPGPCAALDRGEER